ncbi:MAG: M14 family zinc carboxypeptidase, partial [Armatimonadota bacterium]
QQGPDRRIHVEPECDLVLEGVIRADLEEGGRARISVFSRDETGATVGFTPMRPVAGKGDWCYRSMWMPVPLRASHVVVHCEVLAETGQAWFDDVSLRLVEPSARPRPPWVPPVLLVTDPTFSTSVPLAVKHLASGAVTEVSLRDAPALQAIAMAPRVCIAPLGRGRDPAPVADSVKRALAGGSTVVCHLDVAAELLGATLTEQPLAGLPVLRLPLPASNEPREVVLRLGASSRGAGAWYVVGPSGERLFGEVHAERDPESRKRTHRVVFPGLPPGPTAAVRLGICPGVGWPCVVTEVAVRSAERTLGSWLPTELRATGFKEVQEPEGAVQVDMDAFDQATVVIGAETGATRGFSAGDRVPWYGGIVRCGLTELGKHRTGALAAREDGTVVALELPWQGGGRLVACDLLGAEPLDWLEGGHNKYVLLSNTLGRGVRYGRFFSEKPTYDDIVVHLRELAADSALPVKLVEEGPDCEGRQIVSLTFGDPRRPLLLVNGATHGNEFEPALGLVRLCELLTAGQLGDALDLQRFCLKVIPVLGPSGYDAMTRCQASGVNLNRQGDWHHESYTSHDNNGDRKYGPGDANWKGTAPFTEPEAKAIKRIVEEHRIHAVLEFHTSATVAVLPATALPENELRTGVGCRLFREMFRGRYVWPGRTWTSGRAGYYLWRQNYRDSEPLLIQTTARGRLGTVLEVPGYFDGTYPSLALSDLTVCAVLAHFKAFTDATLIDSVR